VRADLVARSYADTLLSLAERHGGRATAEEFLRAGEELAALVDADPRIREFLTTPRLTTEARKTVLRQALAGRVPELFLRFVLVVVDKKRQALLRQIVLAYRDRVDEMLGRVRVAVTVSHEPDLALQDEVRRYLETRLGKAVIPTFTVDPELLGGIVVRVGDQILDGSVRSRSARIRRRLLEVELPQAAAAAV